MEDKEKGLYKKYRVTRTDGSSKKGGRHHNCIYFVIDTIHDKYAIPALSAYAKACSNEYPSLSADLKKLISIMEISEPHKTEILMNRLKKLRTLQHPGR